MTTALSDAFARLSPEIVFDVLKIGCPKFEDLKALEETDAVWGDTIRCGRFQKARMITDCRFRLQFDFETYRYGLIKSVVEEPSSRVVQKNWNAMSFIHVGVQLGKLPLEFENWILRNVSQSLAITFYWEFMKDRAAEVLEILSTRPLSKLIITAYGDLRFVEFWNIPFQKLLKKQSLQRLYLLGSYCNCLNLIEPLLEFIKSPNFVYLRSNDCRRFDALIPLVVKHWLQLTTFPNHMQCIYLFTNKNYSRVVGEMGFEKVAQIDRDHSVHFMDHPCDDSKRIECYIYDKNYTTVELCLTSKEDSVREEFGDYDEFMFRERIQRCGGSFDPKDW